MTTDKDVADDFEKWRADAIKQGYEVTESVWNYEGREIPMISVWPARGTKEHLRMLKEFADFYGTSDT